MLTLCFLGDSHAAHHLREAARKRGFHIVADPAEAAVTFVSQDAGINADGSRDLSGVLPYLQRTGVARCIVITSQVPPGFTREFARGLGIPVYHQAETLRMKDAERRADNPDYIVVGSSYGYSVPTDSIPYAYFEYLWSWDCPIHWVTFEDAEFSKIAVNMTLASQVDNANRLAAAAAKCGANWDYVSGVIADDKRIGRESYLTPGRWQDSPHLMRDAITLKEIEDDAEPQTLPPQGPRV